MKKKLDTKPFNKVYSQEEIDEVDKRIMEAKRKHDAELYDALLKAKDFPKHRKESSYEYTDYITEESH